jgi:YVTN family beta-propeller protein
LVPNEGSGTISIIDTASDAVVGEIKTGGKPRGVAAGRDGKLLYVSNQVRNSVSVIDARTLKKLKDISVGALPWGVAIGGRAAPRR